MGCFVYIFSDNFFTSLKREVSILISKLCLTGFPHSTPLEFPSIKAENDYTFEIGIEDFIHTQ
uniref:Uncharacterized protein n=1 Tax=Glossina palpalis gambiensis TaxID=67801 RepID=A0A1B0BHL0_9MUSC